VIHERSSESVCLELRTRQISRSNELLKCPAARKPAAIGQVGDQLVFKLLCQHLVLWVGVLEFEVHERETHGRLLIPAVHRIDCLDANYVAQVPRGIAALAKA
jgi:hypothetical protein